MSDENFVYEPGGDGPRDTDRMPPARDPDTDVGMLGTPIVTDTKPLPSLPSGKSILEALDGAGALLLLLGAWYYLSASKSRRA
jgi:hypothetical protein